MLVGRYDPASPPFPDIDLTAEDPDRTVSRRHARIRFQGGVYLLQIEQQARNPGEKDGAALTKGTAIPLRPGDCFTLGRVALQFEVWPPPATPRPAIEGTPSE
jgi:predicted component of type VI protein secretion system